MGCKPWRGGCEPGTMQLHTVGSRRRNRIEGMQGGSKKPVTCTTCETSEFEKWKIIHSSDMFRCQVLMEEGRWKSYCEYSRHRNSTHKRVVESDQFELCFSSEACDKARLPGNSVPTYFSNPISM